ncbi:MAG: DNA translocase FtsK [Oscillospiraceae bacterium]
MENSRRQEKPAAAPLSEPPQAPAPEEAEQPPVHTDYKSQFDALITDAQKAPAEEAPPVSNVIPMELPHQMPPLVIDHFDAPKPAPAAQPLPPVEIPEQPEKLKKADVQLEAAQIAQEIGQQEPQKPEYEFPPVSLLKAGSGQSHDGTEEMRQNAERLSDTLQSFGIEAHIINVTRGPSVTRYELELQRGVKLSKVTNLADDIALALGASGVRIAAIPDKISVVGIEVPNRIVSVVMAREVIDSPEFEKCKSRVSFAVGKDIGGNRIIGDIGKLPHLLIAGTTGSGKSVCMNSLIISLLYKAKPEEVKLIMIDPKMVELGIYNGIPHLLIPVVTDPKKAAGSLQWAVTEMMRRYRMMADAGVRDLESYNKQARASADDELEPMPQIVVVIDELADLMLVAAKEVEESICRIAQMGRASGIHLVIATQRPSADVITGLMKANIPSRIAFAVASAMESRIILDTAGAEKLVGKGDMLYAPLGQGKPKRVQGCFITDDEVQEVVSFVKASSEAEYSDSVMAEIDKKAAESGKTGSGGSGSTAAETDGSDGDEMLPAAVDVILETGQASVSMLQRRLKLGYARAARIMDEMEERGIVGPFEGSKPRQLLITREQWQAIKDGAPISSEPVEEEIP